MAGKHFLIEVVTELADFRHKLNLQFSEGAQNAVRYLKPNCELNLLTASEIADGVNKQLKAMRIRPHDRDACVTVPLLPLANGTGKSQSLSMT